MSSKEIIQRTGTELLREAGGDAMPAQFRCHPPRPLQNNAVARPGCPENSRPGRRAKC
jgi:hypothetical protein